MQYLERNSEFFVQSLWIRKFVKKKIDFVI